MLAGGAWSKEKGLSFWILEYIEQHDAEMRVWFPQPGQNTIGRNTTSSAKTIAREMFKESQVKDQKAVDAWNTDNGPGFYGRSVKQQISK